MEFMRNLIKPKIKTSVSPKIAVSVLLVVVGVAFGAFALNGLVPTFMEPSTDTTAKAATATGWTYVYGPGQGTYTDLSNKVRSGADIMVRIGDIPYLTIMVKCTNLEDNYDQTVCYGSREAISEAPNSVDKRLFDITTGKSTNKYTNNSSEITVNNIRYQSNGSGNFTNTPIDIPSNTRAYWFYKY